MKSAKTKSTGEVTNTIVSVYGMKDGRSQGGRRRPSSTDPLHRLDASGSPSRLQGLEWLLLAGPAALIRMVLPCRDTLSYTTVRGTFSPLSSEDVGPTMASFKRLLMRHKRLVRRGF